MQECTTISGWQLPNKLKHFVSKVTLPFTATNFAIIRDISLLIIVLSGKLT